MSKKVDVVFRKLHKPGQNAVSLEDINRAIGNSIIMIPGAPLRRVICTPGGHGMVGGSAGARLKYAPEWFAGQQGFVGRHVPWDNAPGTHQIFFNNASASSLVFFTAAMDFSRAARSSSVRSISRTFSTPFLPKITGTPTNRPSMPYSPSQ